MKHQTRLIAASLSAMLLLIGCQSTDKYFAKLDSWKGQTEEVLLAERGAPDQFFQSNNIRYLTYNSSSLNREKGQVVCSSSNSFTGLTSSTNCTQLYCKEVFKIEKGKISTISYEGNNCL